LWFVNNKSKLVARDLPMKVIIAALVGQRSLTAPNLTVLFKVQHSLPREVHPDLMIERS